MPAASRLLLSAVGAAALVLGTAMPSLAASAAITPGRTTPPAGGTTAIGAGIDVLDDNAQLGERIPATVKAGWHAVPPICAGSAGSEARRVAATTTTAVVLDRGYQCSYASAYAIGTGALRWRFPYHFALNLVVSGSTVYIEHDDPAAFVSRIDARSLSTGKLLWSAEDDDASNEGNITTVGGGLVVAGDTVLDQASGRRKFFLSGAADSPLAGGTALVWKNEILYNSVGTVRAYSLTGAVLWTFTKRAFGANWQPQIHGSLLYLPDQSASSTGMTVLNPVTGAVVRRLPESVAPVAFDGSVGIVTAAVPGYNYLQQLSAIDLTTGKTLWTHVFPHSSVPNDEWYLGELQSAPVIENGLVWVYVIRDTGTPGQLIAYDEVTGALRSTTLGACAEGDGTITIAQGRIFTPSLCGVATYVAR